MLKKFENRGFSLIDVMVALGVLGALASIALPWYGDSVRRSHASEAAMLAAPARLKAQGEAMGLDLPVAPSNLRYSCSRGLPCSSQWAYEARNPTPYVSAIIRAQRYVVVNFSDKLAGPNGERYSLLFYGKAVGTNLSWECLAGDAATEVMSSLAEGGAPVNSPLPAKWAPGGCRTV